MQETPFAMRMTLLACFENLLIQLDAFCTAVRHDNELPAWTSRTETEIANNCDMRAKAIQSYRALWYEDAHEDGRETLTCPGIVGASPETLIAAHACNTAKDHFKKAVLAIKTCGRIEVRGAMTDLHQRWEPVAEAMRRMGAARLNLKQAYRHIPVLEQCPTKIGFTWSKQGRVIQRTSVETARRLLEQRVETPQIRLEQQRLSEITSDEPLTRVRSVCPHLRANIVFAKRDGLGVLRRLMQAPLPILVPINPHDCLPEFVSISPDPPGNPRLRRSDVRIEDEPFLPSIRVHRYRTPYRNS